MSDPRSASSPFQAFIEMITIHANQSKLVFEEFAKLLPLPYLDRTKDEDGPDSYNNVEGALAKITHPLGMYFHIQSLNLVIVDANGEKVGIRSTCLRPPMTTGLQREPMETLIKGLRQRMAAVGNA